MQIGLVFLRANPKSSPIDLVKALGLEDELKNDPPPPRTESFATVPSGWDREVTLTIATGNAWPRRLEATVRMNTYVKENSALLQFMNGRVKIGAPPALPAGTTSILKSIVIQWCNPNGPYPGLDGVAGEPLYVLNFLSETINGTSDFIFDGAFVRFDLPRSDVHLASTWLCVYTWGETPNDTRGVSIGHSNDAIEKGCKSTCQ
jgi:hypothetical protein